MSHKNNNKRKHRSCYASAITIVLYLFFLVIIWKRHTYIRNTHEKQKGLSRIILVVRCTGDTGPVNKIVSRTSLHVFLPTTLLHIITYNIHRGLVLYSRNNNNNIYRRYPVIATSRPQHK